MLPVALCAAAVALLLLAEWRGLPTGVWIAKPLASACFVWAALYFGALESPYGRWILLGLSLCAWGDVLLIPRESPRAFRAGIGSFLLGHLAYGAGFLTLGIQGAVVLVAGVVLAGAAWRLLRWLGPHVGDLRTPVRLYLGVIASMVALAIGAAAAGAPALIPIGAIAFAASDVSVARDRFVAQGFANASWGLPLYYGAQLALAGSV